MQVTLGRTGIVTNKNGFGALPIQQCIGGICRNASEESL